MVQRVYRQVSRVSALDKVIVATDHSEIFEHVHQFGGDVYMTSPHHPSGTDRCREALNLLSENYDFIVNIQGDEPFIDPQQIMDLTSNLNSQIQIATLAKKITDRRSLENPNEVKVIFDKLGKAKYFSRSPLPHCRDMPVEAWSSSFDYYRHVGIYAYREDVLQEITSLDVAPWEKAEGLEQLRWLYHGYQVDVFITQHQSLGIDTPEDLKKALDAGMA